MTMLRKLAMFVAVAVVALVGASEAYAEQPNWFSPNRNRPMFWGGMFAPQPMFFPPPQRQRYYRPRRESRPKARVARAHAPVQKRVKAPRTAALARATSAIPVAASAGAVSCEKAQEIVAEYGFTEIQAETCEGKTYGFNATRDGKPFMIKIVAADGELALVKKR